MNKIKRLKTLNLLAQARREAVGEDADRICVPVGSRHGHYMLLTVNGANAHALHCVRTPRRRAL